MKSDYGVDAAISSEEVAAVIEQAKELQQEARRYLGKEE